MSMPAIAMAVSEAHLTFDLAPGSLVCRRLVRAINRFRPVVVSSWPVQAQRSLAPVGWTEHAALVTDLAIEAEQLLRDVSDRLEGVSSEPQPNESPANVKYALLGANASERKDVVATATLLQLHRSLIHSVWVLVLPAMAADLTADEIARAQTALVSTVREALGLLHPDRTEGDMH